MNQVSFIIPALNEEEHIGGVLDAISCFVPTWMEHEVIVVDNGSRDRTVDIAACRGARCLSAPGCSISTLRNMGARQARWDLLVFLDADVYLTQDWGERIGQVLETLRQKPMLITGSLYGISQPGSWIERVWFAPRAVRRQEVRYMNGGHLIIHRRLFTEVEGFAPHLETGEDCEFCERARSRGAIIENEPDLQVIHAGYPRRIGRFFGRERWHGRGDFHSWAQMAASRPALISLANLVVLGLCGLSALLLPFPWYLPMAGYLLFLVGVSLASAIHRQSGRIDGHLPAVTFLYMVYFSARSLALVDVLHQRLRRRHAPPLHTAATPKGDPT